MFLGRYEHSVDAKGRVAIPARYRDALRAGTVVTKGVDGQLVIYPRAAYEAQAETMRALPTDQADARGMVRWFFGNSHDLEIDSQGRVLIPASWREWAGLDGTAHFVGFGDCFELWAPERLAASEASIESDPAAIAARVGARL